MTFLEVKNLNVRFGTFSVLKNISFSVNEGQVVAFIGPNGGGKTTLFRVLIDAVPYEGQIIWHKEPRISYVPQRFDFDPAFPLTVKELFLLRRPLGDFISQSLQSVKEIKEALDHVGAGHLLNRMVSKLSGGELQRVLIAYALFGEPNILLFDEPTTGIDIEGEVTVYNLISHIAKELGLTVLLISHDLNVVFEHVDQVVCLNRSMFCAGAPKKVLTPEQLQKLYGTPTTFYPHEHKLTGDHGGKEEELHEHYHHRDKKI
jgi:zinc transport system ATP-binding protein